MSWYHWWLGRSKRQIQRRQAATLAMKVVPDDLIELKERRRLAALENQVFGASGLTVEQLVELVNRSKNPAQNIEQLLELCQKIQWDLGSESNAVIGIELN